MFFCNNNLFSINVILIFNDNGHHLNLQKNNNVLNCVVISNTHKIVSTTYFTHSYNMLNHNLKRT